MQTFFCEDDYRRYLHTMSEWCSKCRVGVWAYCLMPNHAHLVLVPADEKGLHRAVGEAHRRYTLHVNTREQWQGHLWQGRFASVVMDDAHLLAAARYIELNPVRARLAERPEDYPWSSARAHLSGRDDGMVQVAPLLEMVEDWPSHLTVDVEEMELQAFRKHERTGRPLGGAEFLMLLETILGRILGKQKTGPKGPRKKIEYGVL
jgi:putative transposase